MVSKHIIDLHARDLFELIRTKPFDRECAEQIIEYIDDVNQIFVGRHNCPSLFLGDAVAYSNLDAVQFLLEYGANPNAVPDCHEAACPLWLTILPDEPDLMDERIEIVKLLLKYGGNPNLEVEGQTIIDELEDEIRECAMFYDLEYMQMVLSLMKQHNTEANNMTKQKSGDNISSDILA